MDRILSEERKWPKALSAPALELNTIIFKHVYWYMQQISGERLQDNWSSCYDLKKRLTPGVILPLPRGYIHAYYHSRQQVGIYLRFQVSVYRTIGPLVIQTCL